MSCRAQMSCQKVTRAEQPGHLLLSRKTDHRTALVSLARSSLSSWIWMALSLPFPTPLIASGPGWRGLMGTKRKKRVVQGHSNRILTTLPLTCKPVLPNCKVKSLGLVKRQAESRWWFILTKELPNNLAGKPGAASAKTGFLLPEY